MNAGPSAANRVLTSRAPDEWLPWTDYVYLWVCPIPGSTRIKVGMTNNPHRRWAEFRTNSPVTAQLNLVCQCPSRSKARELELAILGKYAANRVRGEWIHARADKVSAIIRDCTEIARQVIGPEVRFRDYKPRRPNGEPFRRRRRR